MTVNASAAVFKREDPMPDDLIKLVMFGAFGFFIGSMLMGWAYG